MNADVQRSMAADIRRQSMGLAKVGDDDRRKVRAHLCLKAARLDKFFAVFRERKEHDAVTLGQRSCEPHRAERMSVTQFWSGIDDNADVRYLFS
jgi:hypothetical protein